MDLTKYKKYEPIYVIGHSNIDMDSAVSSKILSSIFNFFGIKSYYAILDKNYEFNNFSKRLLNDCMSFEPVIIPLKDVEKYNWFLTDHNDRYQSVGKNAFVVGSIDHHPSAGNVLNITISDVCCTALYLFKEFESVYPFTKEEKYQIFMAFLSDSTFGKKSRFKESDGILADKLGFGHDYESLFKKYFIPTDLSKGITFAFRNGLKKYQFDNVYFESSYIEAFDTSKLLEYIYLIKEEKSFLGMWIDYSTNKTYAYFKYDGKFITFKYDFIASRATTILNDVLKYLRENNYLER